MSTLLEELQGIESTEDSDRKQSLGTTELGDSFIFKTG